MAKHNSTVANDVMAAKEQPEIGIAEKDRESVVGLLGTLLSDEYVLYTKTRNYHWNVVGPNFGELHEMFEKQYEQLNGYVDEIAERARQLGGHAIGTLAEFLENARIKEEPGRYPDARGMLQTLLKDHEAVIRTLRRDVDVCTDHHKDMGTADFLTGLMEGHEKIAWMLRAYLG
jgi:starvation-inducible DNA-binding protein